MEMEKTVTIGDRDYVIAKLPLGDSTEVLLRVLKLGGGASELNLGAVLAAMTMKDLNFLREKLLGKHCHMINDTGDGVPLTPRIVDNVFSGHPGRLLNLLLQCLVWNFADFLADLDLSSLMAGLAEITGTALEPEPNPEAE